MKKIKILHIIKSLGRGGAEMLLPETLIEHDKSVFEFHYIYFLPWKNQVVSKIEEAGGKVVCLSAKNNIQLVLHFPKIIKYCKQNEIQLIHAHLPWAGFVSRIVFFKTKIPVIYTEHNLQERYHFITKFINKLSFNFQSLAIGVSKDVTNSIKRNINPKIECKTVLNGVNTKSFIRNSEVDRKRIRSQFKIPEDSILVGTVAVFRFQKRLDKWLEIMKEAININSNIYGIIIGAGILEPEIYAKHKELNLEGKVFFDGLQSNVKPFYEAIDIFMMSSSFEGLPIALLEAMSMECAIVSTNAGGIKEVLNHESVLMVDVDDWKKLVECILKFSNNKLYLKEFQSQARLRVERSFSIEVMVSELEAIYLKYKK